MIPRKKRRTLIIVIIVLLVLVISTIFALLYLKTDMFKSNEVLFAKYMGGTLQNFENVYTDSNVQEFEQLLEKNKYTSHTNLKINFMNNIGTTNEDTSNVINKFKLSIDEKVDKVNQINYKDIKLLKEDENIFNIEYMQNDDIYGIKLSDSLKQYVSIQNSNIKALAQKMEMTDEQIDTIPDNIGGLNLNELIYFTQEEKDSIQKTYLNVIKQNVSKDKYSKQSNVLLTINNKNLSTNAYTLTLTIEELNNLYIKLLEELQQDETILSKFDRIDEVLNYVSSDTSIKESFIKNIESTIEGIKNNNIGTEKAIITVYETGGQTVRFSIETQDYRIVLDTLLEKDAGFVQYSNIKTNETEDGTVLTFKKEDENKKITIATTQGMEEQLITINVNTQIENNTQTETITANMENLKSKIILNIDTKKEIVNELTGLTKFDSGNNVVLNDLEYEQIQGVVNKFSEKLSAKQEELKNSINQDEINNMLISIGLVSEKITIEDSGDMSQAEKNRFNTQFELYEGEEVTFENIEKLLSVVEKNLEGIEVASGTELRLKIKGNTVNEEKANQVLAFIEKNKGKKYSVKMEYDENGLLNAVMIIIEKKK